MQELLIGDDAPDLVLGEFLKGEPISHLACSRVYVIEFWAPWCGPCRAVMPHLTNLQRSRPNVTFIGVAVREREVGSARSLVESMGDQIDYRIALDAPPHEGADANTGWMTRHWLDASYQAGIPTAFVVDASRKIAWVGHPIALEEPLDKIAAGDWDLCAAAAKHRETLTANKVREGWRLREEVARLRKAGKAEDIVAAMAAAFAAEPELELQFGAQRLSLLMKGGDLKSSTMDYARHLIEDVCRFDIRALLILSVTLFEDRKCVGTVEDKDYAVLATQAMRRIQSLLDRDPPSDTMAPDVLMQFEAHFARALIATGQRDEALVHARRAYQLADELGAVEEKAALRELITDGESSLPPLPVEGLR